MMDAGKRVWPWMMALCLVAACGTEEEGGHVTEVDTSDAPSDHTHGDTATTDSTSTVDTGGALCPADPPMGTGACSSNTTCAYGTECCCGACYDSLVCSCQSGTWSCYNTDACMMPSCNSCADIEAAHEASIAAARSCATSEDCQVLADTCGVGLGGCYAVVNQSLTQQDLQSMATQWTGLGCDAGAPVCDCAPPPRAVCTDGACVGVDAVSCSSNADCSALAYCDFTEDFCGATGFMTGQGQCRNRPDACDAGGVGVCACDGSAHLNDCEAAAAGQDISRFGGCATTTGNFDCGGLVECTVGQYCSISMNDTPGPAYFANCADLPSGCDAATPSCDCMPADTFSTCSDATGAIVVVYPGG